MQIGLDGLAQGVRFVPSPNCDDRPADTAVELVVVHSISLPPGEFGGPGVEQLFLNRLDPHAHPYYRDIASLRVSAHFVIGRDGTLTQYVPCSKRAWHAGRSAWRGRPECNDYSVGIELEGSDETPFEDRQYERLVELTHALFSRYPVADIVGHSEVAPGRKTDPGPHFDWRRYRTATPLPRRA